MGSGRVPNDEVAPKNRTRSREGSTTSRGQTSPSCTAPGGTLPPSEYFKRQCYLALDADEEPAVDVVEKLGADYFVVSTDYPPPDGAFPEALKEFLPLDDSARRKILWDNCARLYGIPKPAAPLTRAPPYCAAAQ